MRAFILRRVGLLRHVHGGVVLIGPGHGANTLRLRRRATGELSTHRIGNVFVMIGAEPNTEWLQGCLELDGKGFVKTGYDADGHPLASPYETTVH